MITAEMEQDMLGYIVMIGHKIEVTEAMLDEASDIVDEEKAGDHPHYSKADPGDLFEWALEGLAFHKSMERPSL